MSSLNRSPFGQLPYLEFGDLRIGQSGAIARFAARQAGLQGDNDADFAVSEQLIEEFQDLFNIVAKAHYDPTDKVLN
jgi:glutathione S-transferase